MRVKLLLKQPIVEAHAVSTRDSAASETATATPVTNEDVNVTGGQYYSDQNGNGITEMPMVRI